MSVIARRALVVEDTPSARMLVTALLTQQGFDVGADDYITKPFSTPEFLARVTALMRRPRRTAAPAPEQRHFGALTVDPAAREATLDGLPINLTRREFDLLAVLSGEPRVAFTRAHLLERVWGENWFGDDHLVSVHISNLRRKLGEAGRDLILTVRGIGFRMGNA